MPNPQFAPAPCACGRTALRATLSHASTWEQGAFLCQHHGPHTEVFARQLAQGIIERGHNVALPTHPLPIYFMALALALLAILIWQLRRRFPPGSLLITFGILWPIGKLGLEAPRRGH